jgi:hypothetical protein
LTTDHLQHRPSQTATILENITFSALTFFQDGLEPSDFGL